MATENFLDGGQINADWIKFKQCVTCKQAEKVKGTTDKQATVRQHKDSNLTEVNSRLRLDGSFACEKCQVQMNSL